MPTWLARIHPTARRLIGFRLARSVGQGALVVDLALYLRALGWTGVTIGAVLGATGIIAATLSMGVGVASDHVGRKPFLVGAEILTIACALAALFSASPWLLVPAIVLAGFGRGMNGAASFFGPAEHAWLAHVVPRAERSRVYSINLAAGALGMAVGAALAALPELLEPWIGLTAGFRALFVIPALGSLVNLAWLVPLRENHKRADARASAVEQAADRHRENRLLAGLAGINVLNGLGVGLVSPLLTYWFAVHFGVGPAALAPFMVGTFVISGLAALATGYLTERHGVVPVVVSARSLAVLITVLVPLMPLYALAAALYAIRSALNRGSGGARQALIVSLVHDARRGLATSLSTASFQYAQGIGPVFAGMAFDSGRFLAPFFGGAALQALYVAGFWALFRRHDPSRRG